MPLNERKTKYQKVNRPNSKRNTKGLSQNRLQQEIKKHKGNPSINKELEETKDSVGMETKPVNMGHDVFCSSMTVAL